MPNTSLLTSLIAFLIATAFAWLPSDRGLLPAPTDPLIDPSSNATVAPPAGKIRGVNLGSMFVFEPWMASPSWATMGCSSVGSELDCVKLLGQDTADAAFQGHWGSFVDEGDIALMKSYGLNTIRVPLGYWIVESLVDEAQGEYFPRGGMAYLERLCDWAATYGLYVILDLHGAPGAQVANQAFTGQIAPEPLFYTPANYVRAVEWLINMTITAHTNHAFRTVGMIAVLNEPIADEPSLVSKYYTSAYYQVRLIEQQLGVSDNDALTLQFMSPSWQAGNAAPYLGPDAVAVSWDNHRYIKYSSTPPLQSAYLAASCGDAHNLSTAQITPGYTSFPLTIGEWTLSPASVVENDSPVWWIRDGTNDGFYKRWWVAQVRSYETASAGWLFWSWKAELGDYRWSYKDAVARGIIATDPTDAWAINPCEGI